MPAEVMTARTAPPAITPVPSGAGFRSTLPEPKRPSTMCGIVVCVRFTRTRFFFADSMPLRIACGTSLAFPDPYPTTAALGSPTTTSAANERFLPPLTTLVTRLMETTWSLSWYEPASSFLITVGILNSHFKSDVEFHSPNLELQSRFARGVGQCLDASVIDVTTSIENYFCNPLSLGTFGNRFTHTFCHGHVAADTPLTFFPLRRVSGDQSRAFEIVDELNIDVVQRTIHIQTWTLRGPHDLLADPVVHVPPLRILG